MTEDNLDSKESPISKEEERILDFWQKEKIFEKTLNKESEGEFVFYDGPPFATGLPHYGHILAGTIKDVFPRFQTMIGKRVNRQWGWDCHGLPIENLIEKELKLKTKQDIEEMGIENFNNSAKNSVLRYEVDWSKIVPRSGRWVDMQNKYQTMDASYTESIWWAFSELYKKGLVYKGHKSMHLCPRCETTLSNFEVNQGYKDITDLSVTVKVKLKNSNENLLIWTTTPWTLPGNSAIAVNKKIEYVKVESEGEKYIVAKELVEKVFKDKEYKIISSLKGSEVVGLSYEPIFDYYTNAELDNGKKEAMFKVYSADYVTVEDGTGIVHLAPAFGEEDMLLAKENDIPLIQHVGTNGKFKSEVTDFAGLSVKPIDETEKGADHQKTDIEIIKWLAHNGKLFAKEKITHSYPHCWRCDTPLLNYASTSWFIAVTELKNDLLKENAKVSWLPKEIGENRFGKWLEGARDWAVSRARYWGAPLPVWQCDECGEVKVLGSIEDLSQNAKRNNQYIAIRHGESESNVNGTISSIVSNKDSLTEKGNEQALKAGKELKGEKIDLIISSDYIRTKETAEIIAKEVGIYASEIVYDERIRELGMGDLNGEKWDDFFAKFENPDDRYKDDLDIAEPFIEIRKRVAEFLFDIDKKYSGKKILIVSHGGIVGIMHSLAKMKGKNGAIEMFKSREGLPRNAEYSDIDFVAFPHNEEYEFDFHRPYIDEIKIDCKCGEEMKRIPDVFDCWFESGSMPFASHHYPFENKDVFDPEKNKGFPADFIAEGLDQTRGWFYTLLVISVGLFGRSPYKNVNVSGLVLAEDGKKMSKRLKNYPEVNYLFDKYGADATRYYMISSPVIRSEDLRFSEKGVDEIVKKISMRLLNVLSFYEMFRNDMEHSANNNSKNVLDLWILSRLSELHKTVTDSMFSYELDRATRPFMDFIDDLSTWYLRRSRDRFKGDDEDDKKKALETLLFVLKETSVLLAPFMPFISESIYQKLKIDTDPISVHLNSWPKESHIDAGVLTNMTEVRDSVTQLLEIRAKSGIKVRQPLAKAIINNEAIKGKEEYLSIIMDELNVKSVEVDSKKESPELDTELTPELVKEGQARDLIRSIQEKRKEAKLLPKDIVSISIEANEGGKDILNSFEKEIKSVCGIDNIEIISGENIFGEIALKL